jgi:hypothetical protein
MNLRRPFKEQSTAWKEVKTNWLVMATTRTILVLNAASIVSILALWSKLPPLVPLWYSRPWGADQLTHPLWLFILPIGSLLLYVSNVFISMFFMAEYLIFTQMAFLTSLLVSFLSFVALVKILTLVI